MSRRGWGTAARLTTFLGLMLTFVLGLATYGLVRLFDAQAHAATDRSLVAELHDYEHAASTRDPSQSLEAFTRSFLRTRTLGDGEAFLVTLTGSTTLGSSQSAGLLASPVVRAWSVHPLTATRQLAVLTHGVRWRMIAVPLNDSQGTPLSIGTVAAAADSARTGSDLHRVGALAAGEAAIAVLAGTAGSWLLLRRLLRRVVRITDTAAQLGSGALDRRLRESAETDEVGQLAVTFDAMADQLSATLIAQRRLLSDVSHQLRTPLTVARGHLEVMRRIGGEPQEVQETLDLVLDEIEHMRALVERLLMLGHAMEPDFITREPVDLRSFCFDLMESTQVLASRHWVLSEVPDLVVEADAAKVRGALLNLVDNAVRATKDGDTIAVMVEETGDGRVELAVEDSGPGMPPALRTAALGRFARPGAADSTGSGLGLAIAQAVATAHGGGVTIGSSTYGGARVAMTIAPPGTTNRSAAAGDEV